MANITEYPASIHRESSMFNDAENIIDANEAPLHILLVEDVISDAVLTRIALDATGIPYTLTKIKQGNEVLPSLRVDRLCNDHTVPDLIMLDLGLPGMDGFEILAELSGTTAPIRNIPVVILTAHRNFEYISQNYPLSVVAYINKPCNAMELRSVLTRVRGERDRLVYPN